LSRLYILTEVSSASGGHLIFKTCELIIICFDPFIGAVCKAVGISSWTIPDNQMTASSEVGPSYSAYYGRLYDTSADGWCSETADSNDDWLEIDFGKTMEVCRVATQGDVVGSAWTTVFKLSFSTDGNTWKAYRDKQNVEVVG